MSEAGAGNTRAARVPALARQDRAFSPVPGSKAEGREKKGRQGRRYTELVPVRFTPEELARLDELAAEAGRPRSTYLREAGLKARFHSRIDGATFAALGRIGNNLNQLTRTANAMKRLELSRLLADTLAELRAALKEIAP
ncbi:MAG: plasmid mobilization relaxosome protein MobC [Thermoanaerobaculia bacterium]|nr:plasmid mobilization relaxosome protein MobC [Thermoanaerobaculia bacterium]